MPCGAATPACHRVVGATQGGPASEDPTHLQVVTGATVVPQREMSNYQV